MSRITFCLLCLCRSQHTFHISDEDQIPQWGPGISSSMFFTLMVGAPRSPSAPTRGPPSMFFTLMVGAPGSITPAPPRESTVDVFYVDGGCSWIFISTHQRARHRCFFTLMVGAPDSTAPAPPKEPTVDIFYVDGGYFWIFISTHQGAHHRCSVDGRCSRIYSSSTSQGAPSMFLSVDGGHFWIYSFNTS
jgi:hypothetical protein